MKDTKTNASTEKNRNDNRMMIRLLAVGYVLYMLVQIIRSFIDGGEEAPSVFALIVSILVLGGGAVAVLLISWKQYRKTKEQIDQRVAEARAQAALEEEQTALETEEEHAQEAEDLYDEEPAQQEDDTL